MNYVVHHFLTYDIVQIDEPQFENGLLTPESVILIKTYIYVNLNGLFEPYTFFFQCDRID